MNEHRQKKLEWLGLIGLFLTSFGLRWYRLTDFLFFGFEQGRDALIVEKISQLQDFVLVGPKTDIGGVFHGAWYYYLLVIPYFFGQGNPLMASAFLVALSSLTPLLMYWLLKRMTKSVPLGFVAGFVTAISFEFISYSRWLSNVTPAMPLMALALTSLWIYRTTSKEKYFIVAASAAVFASQFEIILIAWLSFAMLMLWLTRLISLPKLKTWLVVGGLVGIIFAPMLVFNLRNDFISVKALVGYVSSTNGEVGTAAGSSFGNSLNGYAAQLARLWQVTLFNTGQIPSLIGALLMVGALGLRRGKQEDQMETRAQFGVFLIWLLMTLPVMLFPRSMGLVQVYVGSGLALIGWWVLAVREYWRHSLTRVLALVLIGLVATSMVRNVWLLSQNQGMFFITIQDDLNYADQRALLDFVHQDAQGQPYRLVAFTIPYFQEEGWQYLQHYHYPQDSSDQAQVIYLIIERHVDAFWVEKWTEELGTTELVGEWQFGLINLQKRQIL